MRRHVVGPFCVVHPAGIGRRETIERSHEVNPHIRIGIFLNHQRCRSMADEKKKRAVARSGALEEARHLVLISIKPWPEVATLKLAVATFSVRVL